MHKNYKGESYQTDSPAESKIIFGNLKNSGIEKVKINSRKMKFGIMAGDQIYLKFFGPLVIQTLLEKSALFKVRYQ